MTSQLQLFAVLASVFLLLVVLELVRRRRLFERYAILWLLSAIGLLAMAIWGSGLNLLAKALGIAAPPNALFVVALGFILLLLLHFSVAVSRLSDQSKVLAQRLALLEERLRTLGESVGDGEAGEQPVALVAERASGGESPAPERPLAVPGATGRPRGS